jgi:hypothetical protein
VIKKKNNPNSPNQIRTNQIPPGINPNLDGYKKVCCRVAGDNL